ncbi:hypothetical protein BT93_L1069 [Corymbia citriodora subsp. variegata]|uniref:DUF4220 domain-containing protein n=1 Tax=Corymbia citriodora subsp. variegata TaxID=360336 RepID=A0A8T0CR32_CORYI|nr:hypothetical protein BT93_L1069 [Corymbia citriodora subsp. variegata]
MAFGFILDLWNKWNIRGFVVLSLLLQVILILFAPLRKKTSNRPVIFLLWLAYLMADSVAAFAVGLISHNQDTITAFSLEDSSLWQRHLLNLIFQVGAAIYVFMRIFPSDKPIVIPTILVFLAGSIKIAERTLALYLSSFPKLRESMLIDDELRMAVDLSQLQLLNELNVVGDGHGCFDEEGAKLDESIVVKHAYSFFQIFKIFIADLIYTKQQCKMSSDYFYKVSTVDALRVISVELNFIYEELHTKALTIRHKLSCIFCTIAFISIVVALGMFNHLKKDRLLKLDVKITHILLFGGIILDGIALFKLIFSDWTVAKIKYTTTGSSKLDAFFYKLVSTMDYLSKPQYAICEVDPNTDVTYKVLDTPLIFRRWSESISACNLFSEALMESPRKICKCNQFWGIVVLKNICSFPFRMVGKIISCFVQASETIARCCGKRSMIANVKYVSQNLFMKKLWIFIFNDVKQRSKELDDPELAARLVKSNQSFPSRKPSNTNVISEDIGKANMHNYIIVWHIATEILYNKDKQSKSSTTKDDLAQVDRREFSKILSDYMLYLLLNQPNLMSDVVMVGIAQKISRDVLRELRHLISDATKDLNGICEKLYNGVADGRPGGVPFRPAGAAGAEPGPTNTSEPGPTNPLKSPLNEGLLLAHLLAADEESKWETMSDTWLWLLKYAAINIKGETHVQVLSKGGELVTFVWLLMAHLGFFFKPEWGLYREYWKGTSVITERPQPRRALSF